MDSLDVKQKNFYHLNDIDNNFHAFNLLPVADLQVVGLRVTHHIGYEYILKFLSFKANLVKY